MPKNKIISIQVLRAIACLLVLQVHFMPFVPYTSIYFCGGLGVDIFFVISGYIIASSLNAAPSINITSHFLINRFCRVVPYYWLFTFVGAIFVFFFNNKHPLEIHRVLKSFLFIPQEDPTLPMGWTLNHEVFFYFFVGISTLFIPKSRVSYIGFVFLSFLVLALFLPSTSYTFLFLKSSVNYTFLLGFFTYFYARKSLYKINNNFFLLCTVLIMLVIIMSTNDSLIMPNQKISFTDNFYKRDRIYFQINNVIYCLPRFLMWGIPSYLLFLAVLAKENAMKNYSNNLFVKIGDASYSIYLFQFFTVLIFLHFKTTNLLLSLVAMFITVIIALNLVNFESMLAKRTKSLINLMRHER